MERLIERTMYASRWLLVPIYAGLIFALLALIIKFFHEVFHTFQHLLIITESELILSILSMVDMALVGSLIIMVMFSSYENFVSKINLDEGQERLSWLGGLDSNTLKLKVASSIVAISSIHLLQIFMEIHNTDNDKLLWYVIIHMTFVVSAILLALLDKLAFSKRSDGN